MILINVFSDIGNPITINLNHVVSMHRMKDENTRFMLSDGCYVSSVVPYGELERVVQFVSNKVYKHECGITIIDLT